MAAEKFNIELDSKFVENLFGLVDKIPPEEVTLEDLKNIVDQIKTKLNSVSISPVNTGGIGSEPMSFELADDLARPKTVLIVDDLGIITYQLEILFKKMGFEVVISQEINDAIDKYKKQDFGFAIIDLFIPTEREGFILLDELKKLSLLCKLNTRIIVMTASSKQEYMNKCINRGADAYIEKSPGWQKRIMDACVSK
jgi:CheY-like chemotaxis protein